MLYFLIAWLLLAGSILGMHQPTLIIEKPQTRPATYANNNLSILSSAISTAGPISLETICTANAISILVTLKNSSRNVTPKKVKKAQPKGPAESSKSSRKKSSRKALQCRFCPKIYFALDHIEAHVEAHENCHLGLKPYSCTIPECNMQFASPGYVKHHLRRKHKVSA